MSTLLKKINGEVNIDNPEKLGVAVMDVVSSSSEASLISQIRYTKAVTLKGIGGQFTQPYNQSVLLGTSLPINANEDTWIETQLSTAMKVELPEKYYIRKLIAAQNHKIDFEYLKYSSQLIKVSGIGFYGDISVLGGISALATIEFNYSTIVVDATIFTDATKFTGLQTLTLTNCPYVTNKSADVKAAIEAAHPGITVTW